MKYTLKSGWIPTRIRRILARMTIYAAWYGQELWGMSQVRVNDAESQIEDLVSWTHGTSKQRGVTTKLMARELNLPPLHAVASGARARVFLKGRTQKTFIKELVETPGVTGAWSAVTYACLCRDLRAKDVLVLKDIMKDPRDLGPEFPEWIIKMKKQIKAAAWSSHEGKKGSSLKYYREIGLWKTQPWYWHNGWEDSIGSISLMQIRAGCFNWNSGYKRWYLEATHNLDIGKYLHCRACKEEGGELGELNALRHMFLDCPDPVRTEARKRMNDEIKAIEQLPTTMPPLELKPADKEASKWAKAYRSKGDPDAKVALLLGGYNSEHGKTVWCENNRGDGIYKCVIRYLDAATMHEHMQNYQPGGPGNAY